MITAFQVKPVHRLPRSGSKTLQDSFNSFVTDTFDRKALFDLDCVSGRPVATKTRHVPSGHFEKHLFFVTFHVRPNSYSARDGFSSYNAQPIFAAFKSWYLSTCRKLLGPKFNKKPLLQPFTMAFFDVEGSREGQAAKAFEIPHVHALMLIHPKAVDQFRTINETGILTRTDDIRISKIDIEPFVDDGRGAEPLMTYASKYPRTNIAKDRHEMTFWSYPDVRPDRFKFLDVQLLSAKHAIAL